MLKNIRVTEDLHTLLKVEASKRGMLLGAYISMLLSEALGKRAVL